MLYIEEQQIQEDNGFEIIDKSSLPSLTKH